MFILSSLLLSNIPITQALSAPTSKKFAAKTPAAILQAVEELNGQSYVVKSGKVYVGRSTAPLAIPTKVKAVFPGEKFMVFLTEDKKVYFQGNLYDQSDMTYYQKPVLSSTKPILLSIQSVEKVMTGRNEILFLTSNRDLYVMGANNLNQLGFKNTLKISKPTKLHSKVRSAATSANTTVVIADDGIFVSGYNQGRYPSSLIMQRIGEAGVHQHVFALEKSLNRSVYQKSAITHFFYLPTTQGGSVIDQDSVVTLKPLTIRPSSMQQIIKPRIIRIFCIKLTERSG